MSNLRNESDKRAHEFIAVMERFDFIIPLVVAENLLQHTVGLSSAALTSVWACGTFTKRAYPAKDSKTGLNTERAIRSNTTRDKILFHNFKFFLFTFFSVFFT